MPFTTQRSVSCGASTCTDIGPASTTATKEVHRATPGKGRNLGGARITVSTCVRVHRTAGQRHTWAGLVCMKGMGKAAQQALLHPQRPGWVCPGCFGRAETGPAATGCVVGRDARHSMQNPLEFLMISVRGLVFPSFQQESDAQHLLAYRLPRFALTAYSKSEKCIDAKSAQALGAPSGHPRAECHHPCRCVDVAPRHLQSALPGAASRAFHGAPPAGPRATGLLVLTPLRVCLRACWACMLAAVSLSAPVCCSPLIGTAGCRIDAANRWGDWAGTRTAWTCSGCCLDHAQFSKVPGARRASGGVRAEQWQQHPPALIGWPGVG
jgi:hypothetical protein